MATTEMTAGWMKLASQTACETIERDTTHHAREGEDMADDDALFQKGMPIRREVLGPEYVDASMARADEFMMSFQRATTAWAWGWAWGMEHSTERPAA